MSNVNETPEKPADAAGTVKIASCRNCAHMDSEIDSFIACEAPVPASVHEVDGTRFDPKIEWAFLVPVKEAEATAAICKCYQRVQ